MSLASELLESLIALLPLALLAPLLFVPPKTIASWVASVLLTAVSSVLSLGLLMMRLVAQCVTNDSPCAGEALADPRVIAAVPGILERYPSCSRCVSGDPSSGERLALLINQWLNPLAMVAAGLCTAASVVVLARFAAWVRKQQAAQPRKSGTPSP